MSWLKSLALFVGIATVPVLSLSRAATGFAWSAPVSMATGLVMILVLAAALFVPAVALALPLERHRTAIFVVGGWFALAFVHAGAMRDPLHAGGFVEPWHWLLLVALAAIAAAGIGLRLDSAGRYLTTFVPILIVVQAGLLLADVANADEPDPVAAPRSGLAVGSPPSIWVVVLDAHASPAALRDLHDVDVSTAVSDLESLGFRVWDDARSNYSQTLVSIPSLLSGEIWEPAEVEAAYASFLAGTRGDTALVGALRDSGMTTRMVPTNWSRNQCGALIDECLDDPRYDEHWYALVRSTPLPDLFPAILTHPWPPGGIRTLDVLAEVGASNRHFTFVHTLASHPPPVLDGRCRRTSARDGELDEQLECTHDVLAGALESIDLTTDVVIVTADPGYESGNISAEPAQWTDAMARDRFSAFTAISTPGGCAEALPERLSGAQIMPLVLNCYGADLPVPAHRFFKVNHQRLGGVGASEFDWDGWAPYAP
jgi:hypothetical protein